MRLLFAGTPEAALPSLRALLASPHEVVGVLTRPDAPRGRGRRLTSSPVASLAREAGVPVLTPTTLRDAAVREEIRALAPDAAPVVAYGALIPPEALAIPRHGWINLHFSLLPLWRGAAPAQRAVLSGAAATGTSVFRIEEGLDTGDVLATLPTPIGATETSGELLARMAEEGADLLLGALTALEDGTARPVPQDHAAATRAPKLTVDEARVDWTRSREEVSAHVRGMSPDPGAWTTWRGARMKVLGVGTGGTDGATATTGALAPGRVAAGRRSLLVGTGGDPLEITVVAPAGRRPMAAADWARGAAPTGTEAFGDTEALRDTEAVRDDDEGRRA